MKPSAGRIVIYRNQDGHDSPGIIVATSDSACPHPPAEGRVLLHLFMPLQVQADYHGHDGVPESPNNGKGADAEHRGYWRWPERVDA